MFSLHVIQAEFGDCLLLEYGTAGAPHFILVDGGPPQIFNDHLKQVLREKVVSRGAKLDRVILSHVDNAALAIAHVLLQDLPRRYAIAVS